MINWKLWLRWSWRDLRERWLQVAAIALIIALGTGVFAGMAGQKTWRLESLDASYERLNAWDIHMELNTGSYVDRAALAEAFDGSGIPGVAAFDVRLVEPTQVDASSNGDDVLVEGELVGLDVTNGGPVVSQVFVPDGEGRLLTEADGAPDQDTAILEFKFADKYDLNAGDTITISGGTILTLVGTGHMPDYFLQIGDEGADLGDDNFAPVFVPLSTAQRLTGHDGLVNDVVFTVVDGADLDTVRAAIEERMSAAFPNVGVEFTYLEDDIAHKMLYTDAEQDQVIWDTIAILFLIGAALGAFNLAGRIVEAQRRQIGVGMALGLPRRWIAFRPLLVGLQIAALGTFFGLVISVLLSQAFGALVEAVMPLPYWEISLYLPGYVRAILLGILLPFLATLIPVWRAVRVQPVDAIHSGYLVAKGGGLSWIMNFAPLPGKSFFQMPFKNLLRAPWRTLLTMLGIAMAVALMVMFAGFLDSFVVTIDQAEDSYLYEAPDRLILSLNGFYPTQPGLLPPEADPIASVGALAAGDEAVLAGEPEMGLMMGGRLIAGDDDLDILLELHDMATAPWRPGLQSGVLVPASGEPGIVIAEKAADDLGLKLGDTVTLEHPYRESDREYRLVQTTLPVVGIHDNPIRALAYMDSQFASLMNLEGRTNLLVVSPADGIGSGQAERALFNQPGVASVRAVQDISETVDEMLNLFTQVLRVVQVIVIIMAFLIAFNSTSINVDERRREISTMFAFGLRLRTVTRMQMLENFLLGLFGTLIGVLLGWEVLNRMMVARVEEQLAEFKFGATIEPSTLLISVLLGVITVTLTPLISIRKMRNMDIPSTLRVME